MRRNKMFKVLELFFAMDSLPLEVAQEIFSYLTLKELNCVCTVSQHWRSLAQYNFSKVMRYYVMLWKIKCKEQHRFGKVCANFHDVVTLHLIDLNPKYIFKPKSWLKDDPGTQIWVPMCWIDVGQMLWHYWKLYHYLPIYGDMMDALYVTGRGISKISLGAGDYKPIITRYFVNKSGAVCIYFPYVLPYLGTATWLQIYAQSVETVKIRCGFLDLPDRRKLGNGQFRIQIDPERRYCNYTSHGICNIEFNSEGTSDQTGFSFEEWT